MSHALTIETTTHGRVLIEDAADPSSRRLIVAFHGYAQNAEDVLAEVRQIPGVSSWRIASVQALHRFYSRARGGAPNERVVASWMTREDRDQAIADNIAYVDRAIDEIVGESLAPAIVFVGFSQGVAMAYRAALLGRHPATGIIALGGDVPPELMTRPDLKWPPVLIGAGATDGWYTAERLGRDEAWLLSRGIEHEICRFDGGHEWTQEFLGTAGRWLTARDRVR